MEPCTTHVAAAGPPDHQVRPAMQPEQAAHPYVQHTPPYVWALTKPCTHEGKGEGGMHGHAKEVRYEHLGQLMWSQDLKPAGGAPQAVQGHWRRLLQGCHP